MTTVWGRPILPFSYLAPPVAKAWQAPQSGLVASKSGPAVSKSGWTGSKLQYEKSAAATASAAAMLAAAEAAEAAAAAMLATARTLLVVKEYGVGRGKAAAQLIPSQPAKSELLLLLPLLPLLLKPLLLLTSQMATLGLTQRLRRGQGLTTSGQG